MNKRTTLLVLLTSILFSVKLNAQVISNCPAAPYSIEVNQPNGTSLTIIGKGNSLLSYTETIDGYTLLKNQNTGLYEYAVQDAKGDLKLSGMVASSVRQGAEISFLNNIKPHLTYSPEIAAAKKNEAVASYGRNMRSSAVAAKFPTKGVRKVLVLLIQYKDMPATFPKANFDSLMNQTNYTGTGSFKDFYLASSFGQLTVNADVFGWYTSKNNYAAYGKDSGGDGAARPLIAEAIDAAHAAGIDFSKYDNDKDGNVDGIIVVHAGPGAEVGGQTQYIWSHRGGVYPSKRYNNVNISDYMINPEKRGSSQTPIGVFCHEFGHGLGLPDLYDTDDNNGTSEGLGEWCLMAGGPYLGNEASPAGLSAWCKIDLGWQTPTTVGNGSYTLYPASQENKSYKVLTSNPNEYFLFESRTKAGIDRGLRGEGLAIYKINLSKTIMYRQYGSNNVNADETNKGVQIYEADGHFDLDNGNNRADAGDLFPGSYNKKIFNDNTVPNAHLADGSTSSLDVNGIKKNNSSITFNIGPAVSPLASFNASKTSGCLSESFTFNETSSGAITAFKWDFGADATPATALTRGPHTVTYSTIGNKTISLITIGPNGNDTITQAGPEIADVNAVGNVDKHAAGINENINYTATGSATNWKWIFGDGTSALTQDAQHAYQSAGVYSVSLTASTLGCSITSNYTVVISDGVSSINKLEKGSFSIYPNPSNGLLSIKPKNDTKYNYSISNMIGQVQIQKEFLSGESKLDISNLSKGVYFLTIDLNGEKQVHKLVKN